MKIKQAIVSSRLRVQAEAVALELPQQLALDIYDGILADDTQDWSKKQYLDWTRSIEAKYQIEWEIWKYLYMAVSHVMSEFGGLLE